MWEQYHQLRISRQFKEEWEKFMTESVGQHAKPTLYQYVSHRVFKKLLEVELEVAEIMIQKKYSPSLGKKRMHFDTLLGTYAERYKARLPSRRLKTEKRWCYVVWIYVPTRRMRIREQSSGQMLLTGVACDASAI